MIDIFIDAEGGLAAQQRAVRRCVEHAGLGDRDTICAMVGGIVALSSAYGLPAQWISSREMLPILQHA